MATGCNAGRGRSVRFAVAFLFLLAVFLHAAFAPAPAFAQDAFDDPFAEGGDKPPAGDAPAGDAPAGDAPAGDAPAGDAPADGEKAAEAKPAETAPDVHEDEKMQPYRPRDSANEPKDPFEPKIEPPMPVVAPTANQPVVPTKKEIPPLPISVAFIVGSESNRMALLELNGKPYEMRAGEAEEGGLFKVLEITEKDVTIYDSRVQKNRVIKLSEN